MRSKALDLLGVDPRRRVDLGSLEAMRPFADQAAIAIANARAFEEIQRPAGPLQAGNGGCNAPWS